MSASKDDTAKGPFQSGGKVLLEVENGASKLPFRALLVSRIRAEDFRANLLHASAIGVES